MTTFLFWDRPWVLLLLALPLIWAALRVWLRRRAHQPTTVFRLPTGEAALSLPSSMRVRLRWLPRACFWCGWCVLAVCLAGPREGARVAEADAEGIAIQLVLDRSPSMRAMDFTIDGQRVDRLTTVKRVAGSFLLGDPATGLPGRPDDLVGLIVFAAYADVASPLTLDHSFIVDGLAEASIATGRGELTTSIGDALALAVERLEALPEAPASRVVVLLTDGENTSGRLTPVQAAELAARFNVRVYTIGVGTRGLAPVPTRDLLGRTVMRQQQVRIDEDTLREVASRTGGRYFRATDTASLTEVYRAIDALETTRTRQRTQTRFRELAVEHGRTELWPAGLGWLLSVGGLATPGSPGATPPLLAVAAACLALGLALETTWLRGVGSP